MTMRRAIMTLLIGLFSVGTAAAVAPGRYAGDEDAVSSTAGFAAEPARRLADADTDLSSNPLWTVPLHELRATRQRPLFAPSRRPAAAPAATYQPAAAPPPPPTEPEKPQLSLVGTVAGGQDSDGIGVFLDRRANNVVRLKVGEQHDGWAVRKVQRGEVVLEKGGDRVALSLPAPDTKGVGNAPVPLAPLPPPIATASQPSSSPPGADEEVTDWDAILTFGQSPNPDSTRKK